MTCPHYTPVSPHAGACAMLAPHGISLVAGPANPNYPCPACQAAWPAGTALAAYRAHWRTCARCRAWVDGLAGTDDRGRETA